MSFKVKINLCLRGFLAGLLLMLVAQYAKGQNSDQENDSLVIEQEVFSSDDPLQCSLTFNIKKFRKEKMEGNKIPAILTYHKNDSVNISKDIHIEARGQSRKEICYFPPIKLKLKKTSFNDPYLEQVKTQKLVSHCNSSKNFEEYLLKEYLTYKLFNVLTNKSFRVQLMKVNYIDSEDKVKPITRFAFLIEHKKIMAVRNDCMEVNNEKLGMKHVEKSSMIQCSLFQYMIGNVDWSIPGLHNVKLIKSNDFTKELPFVVPYDFDHAGLVNASYAVNVRDADIPSVRIRVFDGMCYSEEEYTVVIQKFFNHKSELFIEINNFDLLKVSTKKGIISYLDEFYEIIGQPDFYKKYILPNCRKINK